MKKFISYEDIRVAGLKLAYRIYKDGFIPDIMYVSLRGGAYLGNIISEFFKFIKREKPLLYAAVVARSYDDLNNQKEIMIDGWTYDPSHLRTGDKVLLVDDIFDSGRTINYLKNEIIKKVVNKENVKVAVIDYKVHKDYNGITPDYFCHKYTDASSWIHYKNHELVGIKKEEYNLIYDKLDNELIEILDFLTTYN